MVSAIHQNESAIGIQWPLPLKSPSHLPPDSTSLGGHRALALGSLCHKANFHWLSTLHMVMHMFQFFCLNLSHPFLPLLCPQVCSLCLCLYYCPTNRFVSGIFLDSIYTCWYAIAYYTEWSKSEREKQWVYFCLKWINIF